MSVYENWLEVSEYTYLKKKGQPSLPGRFHQIYCQPNFHKGFEFIFVTAGEQDICVNGVHDVAKANDIVFVNSFVPHSFGNNPEADGYVLVLNDWYLRFFKSYYEEKCFPTLLRNHEANQEIIDYIKDWHSRQNGSDYRKFNQANLFLEMVCDHYPPRVFKRKRSDEVVVNILSYIDENYCEDISLKRIADDLGYAKEYCSKLFNQVVDESFRKYLNRVRILKFQEMWVSQAGKKGKTILQLAYDCGFESQSTFYRAYREVFGMPPAESHGEF